MTSKFPSKRDVVETLLREDPSIKQFNRLILLVEFKKLSKNWAVVTAELVSNGKVTLKGSYTCRPETNPESSFDWDILKINESYAQGFSLDFKGQTVKSRISDGFNKSIQEGRIPFIPK